MNHGRRSAASAFFNSLLALTTGTAYALLGAMPMIMLTGQKGIMSSRPAKFQIVDVVSAFKPLTKLSLQIVSTSSIPTLMRDAFRIAMGGTAGPRFCWNCRKTSLGRKQNL